MKKLTNLFEYLDQLKNMLLNSQSETLTAIVNIEINKIQSQIHNTMI